MSVYLGHKTIDAFAAELARRRESADLCRTFWTEALIFCEWFRKTYPAAAFPDGLTEAHIREFHQSLRESAQEMHLEPHTADKVVRMRLVYCSPEIKPRAGLVEPGTRWD